MAEVQTSNTDAGEMAQIFIEFVMMQSQNTALCLGLINDPRYPQQPANIPMARLFIDQLAVIKAKTTGNLSADEQKVIDSALQEMELAFVHVVSRTEGYHPGESLAPELEPAPPVSNTPVAEVEAPAPVPETPAPAAPTPPAPEESRKRFSKSYGA
jgi:hypothetical protein